jgi:peptidoglycan/LPS O-acetylase OafA/YrhL
VITTTREQRKVRSPSRPNPPAHLAQLDAVRALGLLLVLVIHADHWPLQQGGADRAVWSGVDMVSRASLPLFMIMSGLLLAYLDQDRMPLRRFLNRRFARSLVPWLVWTPIYTLIGLFLTREIPMDIHQVVSWWSLGAGHLWYLLLVPQLYIVFRLWPRGPGSTAVAAAVALAVQTAFCAYRLYAPATAPLNGVLLAYGGQLFVFWIGYFALGVAVGRRLARGPATWPSWPFWPAAAVGAWLVLRVQDWSPDNADFANGIGGFLRPVLPVLAVSLFFAVASAARSLREHPRAAEVLGRLGRYSLGVYIVHEALMYLPGRLLAGPLLQRHLPLSILGVALLVAATLALAYLATRLIAATRFALTLGLNPEPITWGRPPASAGETRAT